MDREKSHEVKKVVLPSGKTIEVVLFPERADETGHATVEPEQDLSVCVACACRMVYPGNWEEAGPGNWSVILCCPNCGHEREGVFTQATVESFDEQLDEGADVLGRDYKRLVRANLVEEIDRFVEALRVDAILPEDF
jgi:hypothetical protein